MKKFNLGVTLMEIVLATVLASMVGIAFGALYATSQRYLIQTSLTSTAQGEASFAIAHIRRNLLVANLTAGVAGGNMFYRRDESLTLPGTPGNHANDIWAGYQLNGTNLDFFSTITGANPPTAFPDEKTAEIIARNVTALTFTQLNNAEIRIDLTVTKTTGGENRTTRLQTIVSPRGVAKP